MPPRRRPLRPQRPQRPYRPRRQQRRVSVEEAFEELAADELSEGEEESGDEYQPSSDSDEDDNEPIQPVQAAARERQRAAANAANADPYAASTDWDEFSGFEDMGLVDLEANFRAEDDFMGNWVEGPRPAINLPFTAATGFRRHLDMPENPEPIDFVNLFLDDDHYETIATETNRYAQQYLDQKRETLKPHSRFHGWKPTDKSEIKVFLGLVLGMGLVHMRDIRDYWSTNEVFNHPFYPRCMTRDRFWLLMTFLHLSDNTLYNRNAPNYSPLNKMGIVYKSIIHRFTSLYRPGQNLSIDEGTVPWRGNLSFRCYNKDKPKKYGMKAYMLCDASNGYCCKFQLYTGKTPRERNGNGKIYDTVMDLVSGFEGKGHHLFVDNFYTSPTLFVNLWLKKIGATGTLRVNRKGIPKTMQRKELPKGETFVMHNQNLEVMKYHDRKVVYLLSTVEASDKRPTGKTNRRTGEAIYKPNVVISYDKYMGGVDRADQMLSYTAMTSKTLKWWKRLFFHILNLVVLNAYLIYKQETRGTLMSALKFRAKVVQSLVAGASQVRQSQEADRNVNDEDRISGRNHYPEKIMSPNGKTLSRQCTVCSAAKKLQAQERIQPRRKGKWGKCTVYQCGKCRVSLCVTPCFRIYHTEKHFAKAFNEEMFPDENVAANANPDADVNADDDNPVRQNSDTDTADAEENADYHDDDDHM